MFNLNKPCSACPFRINAAPGWLGSYTAQEIVDHIRLEIPFYCHQQIENEIGYDDPNWQKWAEENADHCAGSLVFAKKMCKLPRNPDHAKAVKTMQHQEILFPPQKFIEYHNG